MDAFKYSPPTLTLLNHVIYSEQENKVKQNKTNRKKSACAPSLAAGNFSVNI